MPPSVAALTIFDVFISIKPRSSKKSLIALRTRLRIINICFVLSVLRSMNLASNLVSSSAPTFPVVSSGKTCDASLSTSIRSGNISYPDGAFFSLFTLPSIATTDSRGTFFIRSNSSFSTSPLCNVTWAKPLKSRTMRKKTPPKSRFSCTQPATVTSSPSTSAVISVAYLRFSIGDAIFLNFDFTFSFIFYIDSMYK
ncbi:hypothetical protein ES705_50755 [subsurface metagenome]